MVVRRMSTKEARANFADLLGLVYYTKEPVIVERKGKPVAVVINPTDFEEFQQLAKERLFQTIREIQERNADKDPDDVLRDVTEAVEEVRQERYEQRIREPQSSR
jgi:prevent-host-death family protein